MLRRIFYPCGAILSYTDKKVCKEAKKEGKIPYSSPLWKLQVCGALFFCLRIILSLFLFL